jgi:hypothetical protein
MPRLCSRSGRQAFLVVPMAAVVLLAAACSSPGPAKAIIPPGTPAGAQLW